MHFDLPQDLGPVYESLAPIRWSDMDALGHLNNTNYFRCFESVRIDWLTSLGYNASSRTAGLVIVDTYCNYHQAITYPAHVRIRLYARAGRRSSFKVWATMEELSEAEPQLCATSGSTIVWADLAMGKSAPLPKYLHAAMSA